MKSPRDNSIGAQMHIASQLLRRRLHKRIQKLGLKITIEQIGVLEVLKFNGALKMSELARITVKENAVITRMVDILEREKYVQRKPAANDRRVWEIHTTKSGLELFDMVIPEIISELKDANSCLTDKEYEEGIRIVKKIIKYNEGF